MLKRYIIILILLIIVITQINSVQSQNYNRNSYISPEKRENILIILDSSYSMEEKINSERKIDIAKRTINDVLSKISPDVWLGLRVYGHKSDFLGFRACRASELKVPIAPNSKDRIKNEVDKMKPVGWTPITYSIQQALDNDFKGISGKKRIILVSDGMETCNGSPCDYAVDLVKNNIDLKIDVIGFALNDPAAVSQLKCTALATKGKFFSANNPEELQRSLINSLNIQKEVQGIILK